jgi:hypothetical protein
MPLTLPSLKPLSAAAAAVLVACAGPAHERTSLKPGAAVVDSAQAAHLAIAAVTDTSDTLVYWTATDVLKDGDGYLVTVAAAIRPRYVAPRPDGGRPVVFDGSIIVRVQRDGHVEVVEIIKRVHG